MCIRQKYFPGDISKKYNIDAISYADGYVYIRIKKSIYGLKQAAIIEYNNLVQQLSLHGYHPIPHTSLIWKHKTKRTKLCLCLDYFWIKYYSKDDDDHLLDALQNFYKITVDWNGENYCGLTLNWHHEKGYIYISMPGYVKKTLQ